MSDVHSEKSTPVDGPVLVAAAAPTEKKKEGDDDDSDDDDSDSDSSSDSDSNDDDEDDGDHNKTKKELEKAIRKSVAVRFELDLDEDAENKETAKERLREYRLSSHFNETLEFVDTDGHDIDKWEAWYGYNFTQYLAGRKNLDRLCNFWHGLFLFQSIVLFMAGVTAHWFLGYLLIEEVQSKSTFGMYSNFVKRVNRNTDLIFPGYIKDVGIQLMALNSIYAMCALFYMIYPFHRFNFTIPAICMITGTTSVIEMGMINLNFKKETGQNDGIIRPLKERLNKEYRVKGANEFSVTYDYLAIWLHCCGIEGHFDFYNANLNYVDDMKVDKHFTVPPTCCSARLFESKGEIAQRVIENCAMHSEPIYKKGCFEVFGNVLERLFRYYSAFIVVHLLDTAVHAFLYRHRIDIMEMAIEEKFGYVPYTKRRSKSDF